MSTEETTYDAYVSSSAERRRLVFQEELILDVTETILEVLEERGMTQAELAKLLGKSRSHVSQILTGKRNLTLRTLSDLGDALGRRVVFEMLPKTRRTMQQTVVDLAEWKSKRHLLGRLVDDPYATDRHCFGAVQGMRS